MKSWRGIWSPSGNCFQKRNCILFLFKKKLYYFYHCPPSQMLPGRSSRSMYKTLWAKSILQQPHKERTANKSHFARLGSLLLVGREASADQWNWDTKAEVRRSWAELGWTLGLEGKCSLTRGTTWEQLVTSYLPYSKSPTTKELNNSHLERQKSPQGRECAGGGTSEGEKNPGWLGPSGLHAAEMKVEVLILLPWILTAVRARAYSTGIPKNSTCLSNHTGPHGALFSLTSFWSNGILQLSKRRNGVFVVKAHDQELGKLASPPHCYRFVV